MKKEEILKICKEYYDSFIVFDKAKIISGSFFFTKKMSYGELIYGYNYHQFNSVSFNPRSRFELSFSSIKKIMKAFHKQEGTECYGHHYSMDLMVGFEKTSYYHIDNHNDLIDFLESLEPYFLKALDELSNMDTLEKAINYHDLAELNSFNSTRKSGLYLCFKGIADPKNIDQYREELIAKYKLTEEKPGFEKFNFCYNYIKENYKS